MYMHMCALVEYVCKTVQESVATNTYSHPRIKELKSEFLGREFIQSPIKEAVKTGT